jgi:hypothetical protein
LHGFKKRNSKAPTPPKKDKIGKDGAPSRSLGLFGQNKETIRVDITKGVELSTVDAPRQPRAVILAFEDVFVGV